MFRVSLRSLVTDPDLALLVESHQTASRAFLQQVSQAWMEQRERFTREHLEHWMELVLEEHRINDYHTNVIWDTRLRCRQCQTGLRLLGTTHGPALDIEAGIYYANFPRGCYPKTLQPAVVVILSGGVFPERNPMLPVLQDNAAKELIALAKADDRTAFWEMAGLLMPVENIDACWRGTRKNIGKGDA